MNEDGEIEEIKVITKRKKGLRNAALFTSKTVEYRTPKDLYQKLDDKYHFVLDPCTTKENHLSQKKCSLC